MNSYANALLRSEAQRLASTGSYQEALELLGQIPTLDGAALRARIYCQQGLFAKGAQCWQEVIAAKPEDEEARKGLALAESLARSPLGRVRLHARRWMLAVAAVVLAAAGLAAWRANFAEHANSTRALTGSVDRLEKQVEALNSSVRESTELMRQVDRAQHAEVQNQEQLRGQLLRMQQSLRRMEKALAESNAR
jgi:tetratricopeptide (TPR) repeat protein